LKEKDFRPNAPNKTDFLIVGTGEGAQRFFPFLTAPGMFTMAISNQCLASTCRYRCNMPEKHCGFAIS